MTQGAVKGAQGRALPLGRGGVLGDGEARDVVESRVEKRREGGALSVVEGLARVDLRDAFVVREVDALHAVLGVLSRLAVAFQKATAVRAAGLGRKGVRLSNAAVPFQEQLPTANPTEDRVTLASVRGAGSQMEDWVRRDKFGRSRESGRPKEGRKEGRKEDAGRRTGQAMSSTKS